MEYYNSITSWKHVFTKKYLIKDYMDKYLLPLINKYQNYSHSSTFTIELHKLSDINTWFPLFELDNPPWWIINEFFDHCDTYETYTRGMNTTEVLKRITTITNIFTITS